MLRGIRNNPIFQELVFPDEPNGEIRTITYEKLLASAIREADRYNACYRGGSQNDYKQYDVQLAPKESTKLMEKLAEYKAMSLCR